MARKIISSFIILLFQFSLLAQSENTATVEQEGTNLEVLIVQESRGNEVLIEQIGSNSTARARQFGPDNRAEIHQEGQEHIGIINQVNNSQSASLHQLGYNHQAYMRPGGLRSEVQVVQHGSQNFAEQSEGGYQNNATIEQYGHNGIVYQRQAGINRSASVIQLEGSQGAMTVQNQNQGDRSDYFSYASLISIQGPGLHNYAEQSQYGDEVNATVAQQGNFNDSYQIQNGDYGWIGGYRLRSGVTQDGIGNYALTDQFGSYHSADITQMGTDNEVEIHQTGTTSDRFTSNSAWVTQEGRENIAMFDQQGGGHGVVNQSGNYNELMVTQRNSGNSGYEDAYNLIANQTGNHNMADLSQSGLDNLLELNQTGNNNVANLSQSGRNNLLEVNQLSDNNMINFSQTGSGNTTIITQ